MSQIYELTREEDGVVHDAFDEEQCTAEAATWTWPDAIKRLSVAFGEAGSALGPEVAAKGLQLWREG